MELLIDGERCDLAPGTMRVPGFDAEQLTDLQKACEGRRLQLLLPATPINDRLFGYGRDPETADRFHAAPHTAELRCDGGCVMRGAVRLLRASDEGYGVELLDSGAGWVGPMSRMLLHDLAIPYEQTLSPVTIRNSWTEEGLPVRFFPVQHDNYPQQSSGNDLLTRYRTLSVDDYHPFLHIATMLRQSFAECGYTLRSDFLESDFFRSLYMSGSYVAHRMAGAEAGMGFRARRLGPVSATADYRGRVEADPSIAAHSVGNLVETATPYSVDADGEVLTDLYNNGRCFGIEEGRILFRPTTTVLPIGFRYRLRYTTDHRIRSRERLTGFDSIYLEGAGEIRFTLANRYTDHRPSIAAGHSYRVLVFDHAGGASYRLLYTLNGVADRLWVQFAARSAIVTTPSSGTVRDARLQLLRNGAWVDYEGDWALYDGYVGETGRTTVEMSIKSPAEVLTPTKPKYFHRTYFFGAEEGQELTLHKECSLQPIFGSGGGFGERLTFNDVLRLPIRPTHLIRGLAQLFNLRFRTDEQRREVRIEPFDTFYRLDGEAVDWRDRVDLSQPVELTDTTAELPELRTWCYGEEDGVILRWESADGSILGLWQAPTEGYGALEGERISRNPLFHPTLSTPSDDPLAPSVLRMQVGDREDLEATGPNFTTRIVRYFGMQQLPAGEFWSDSASDRYPLAAFHLGGGRGLAPETLCFEDRDGAEGLHRFYDRQLSGENRGGRITLTLRLAPHEFEALLTPDTGSCDIRSLFRLRTPFGEARGILRRIDDFDPASGTVRCTFDRTDR